MSTEDFEWIDEDVFSDALDDVRLDPAVTREIKDRLIESVAGAASRHGATRSV